jgi:hypothetical protein
MTIMTTGMATMITEGTFAWEHKHLEQHLLIFFLLTI